jgi:prepilin-type N-terminal cleavage/methylation domain-containing protein
MSDRKSGFTLVEVLVAVVIFAFGVLSMAAFASLNYMYLRVNQMRAKLHVMHESIIDDMQSWAREPALTEGPARFDSVWYGAAGGAITGGTTLQVYAPSGPAMSAVVLFDSITGTTPYSGDTKIFLTINSTAHTGDRTFNESARFALANYGMGE